MSNVPEQVRRAAERANEILNQANTPVGDPPVEPVVENTPAVQPPEPATPVVVPPPAEPAAPAEPVLPATSDWEQKYKTLQGVLRAETTKLRATIDAHEATIASLRAAPVAPVPPAANAPARDPKDEDTYGPEMLDLIERRAQAIVKEQLAALQPQFEQTRAQVENISRQVYKTDEERFYGELERAVPDYAAVNVDPRWLSWLAEVDPLSGVARQAYLDRAGQTLDHVHAANLFNAFKSSVAAPAPAPVQPPAATPPAVSPSPRPVGAATAPRLQAPGVDEVRRSDIGAHYKRVATDAAYRISAEKTDFEARMQAAVAAGKIVEG